MANHTPGNPKVFESNTESVNLTNQILIKFMILGIKVSPAPRKAPEATMEAANKGSANASILSTWTPSWHTCISGLKIPIIKGAAIYIKIPFSVITAIPSHTVIRVNLRTIFRSLAPMLCPTRVAAASAIPYPGI